VAAVLAIAAAAMHRADNARGATAVALQIIVGPPQQKDREGAAAGRAAEIPIWTWRKDVTRAEVRRDGGGRFRDTVLRVSL
jgi:hypothetical protein